MKRGSAILAGVLVLAGLVALLSSCDDGGQVVSGSTLRVLYSGETNGELEPCNCSGKMAGGLPLRGGYVQQVDEPFVLVDVGCVGRGARDFEAMRAHATLRAMKKMNYDAVNIGEHELWLGAADFKPLTELGVPFVSANVLDDDGKAIAPPFLIVKRNGLDVAITGIIADNRYQPGPGLRVDSARETLARLVPQLQQQAGVIVVLADMDKAAVTDLAGEFPEVTLFLFRGRKDSFGPEKINRSIVASIYGEALYLGDLELTWTGPRQVSADGRAVEMNDSFSEDVAVRQASIEWYKQQVEGKTFIVSQARPGWERIKAIQAEAGNGYVGSEACKSCHNYQYDIWQRARHAHAMKSLEAVDYDYSPECVVCHVVGYGAADGYVSMEKTPQFGQVGCEACHGPGEALLTGNCKGIARPGTDACKQCHTLKRHPDFNYERHWALIDHRERKRP